MQFIKALISDKILLRIVFEDLFDIKRKVRSNKFHLDSTMKWLTSAQDNSVTGGIPRAWDVKNKWLDPYPETTGYIIPTFIDYFKITKNHEFLERAIKMGKWESRLQLKNGAFPDKTLNSNRPFVFDTAQVIQGFNSLYQNTGQDVWLENSKKAADWVISKQNKDGSWIRCSNNREPHSYYTRVSWPLMELAHLNGSDKFYSAAEKNVKWVLSMQKKNGWIDKMSFSESSHSITHTIAYTYEGLLGCNDYINNVNVKSESLDLVNRGMEKILFSFKNNPKWYRNGIPVIFDENWSHKGNFSCLPGNAQIAKVWLWLFKISKDRKFFDNAKLLIDQIKMSQINHHGHIGAVPGSYPIWGKYGAFSFLNWGAKFFADALIMMISQQKILKNKDSFE